MEINWPEWETVRLIGRGSFGSVYEIRREILGDVEKAALKVISIPQNASDIEELYADGYDDESITTTFHNHLKSIVAEYTLMRKLKGCSNIVNCDDVRFVQHDDGIGWTIYIKMELLEPLIKALLGEVTEDTVVKIAKDLCTALELCRKHGIIHRDIKPQNIFMSPNGDFKLGDFGIAKTVEKTMGGTKIGTYKYMAPEVYKGLPYGASADIYSLGLVLYWLLNERRMPFLPLPPARLNAGMDEEARNRRLSGEVLPPPTNGSAALKRIVLKACAYQPEDRYGSAAEMLRDLRMLGETEADAENPVGQDLNAVESPDDKTVGIFTRTPNRPQTNLSDRGSRVDEIDRTVKLSSAQNAEMKEQRNPAHQDQLFSVMTEREKDDKKKRNIVIGAILAVAIAGIIFCAACLFVPGTEKEEIPEITETASTTAATEETTVPTEDECAKGHSWENASYYAPRTCSVCGLTDGRSLGYPLVLCEQISNTNRSDSTTDVAEGNWKDIHGKIHEDSIKFWVADFGSWENEESAVYNLDGQFDTMEFSLALGEESQYGAEIVIKIWADGSLIYESEPISKDHTVTALTLDIQDTKLIRITCSTSSTVFCHGIADVLLYN